MGLTMGLTELFASCQFVPSAQRIGPPTGPSHLEMTPSSTSSSEAATSRTWLCVNRPNQHALFLRTPPLSRYTVTHTAGGWGVFRERSGWNSNRLCCPRQSSMSSSSSSSAAAAPTPFQSAGSYGLFNRAPVPAYNQFSASPLVSPQFGPVGVGKHNTLAHRRVSIISVLCFMCMISKGSGSVCGSCTTYIMLQKLRSDWFVASVWL